MLVDSHCHLEFPDFQGELDQLVERARTANTGTMLTIGTRLERYMQPVEIAQKYENIFCTVGTHPHNATDEQSFSTSDIIELAASHEKIVGIGETGLDFHYNKSPRQIQEKSFRNHIAAARQTGLPLVIHTRSADDEMAQILSDEMKKGVFGGVLHCFSSGEKLADMAHELGLYISFSGILTFKTAGEIRQVAKNAPAKRILVETDAPYLAPVPMRGKRNEPAYVAHTAACLARIRQISLDEITRQTSKNFFSLFKQAVNREEAAG